MNLHTIIVIAFGFIEILLALFVFAKYQKTASINSLLVFLFSIGIMSILVGMIPSIDAPDGRLLIGKFAFLAGALTFIGLFSTALYFPLPSSFAKTIFLPVVVLSLVIVSFLIFFPGVFLDHISIEDGIAKVYPGQYFWVFTLITAALLLSAFVIMLKKISLVGGEMRSRAKIFAWLILITGIIGVLNDNLLPILGMYRSPFGLEAGGLIALYVASVVLKKNAS